MPGFVPLAWVTFVSYSVPCTRPQSVLYDIPGSVFNGSHPLHNAVELMINTYTILISRFLRQHVGVVVQNFLR